jgi:hypothetical protein
MPLKGSRWVSRIGGQYLPDRLSFVFDAIKHSTGGR